LACSEQKKSIDFSVGFGIAVREYQTDIGLAGQLRPMTR
jgi:hypothetical protein